MTRTRKILLTSAMVGLTLAAGFGCLVVIPRANAADDTKTAKPAKVNYLPIPDGDYKIDQAHTVIGFSIRHNEISLVSGRFKDFTGAIHYDAK
ncbi:MAG TPA: YceI family protein, partial [Pyrinomonadaceae bacterium]|nr:YceI family protein [Pyrinomonadaceae bacterium]